MKILRYRYKAYGEDLEFSEVDFKNVNLIVGDTATGKTRLMNTLFNLGKYVATDAYKSGAWDITFIQSGITYHWVLEALGDEAGKPGQIVKETLSVLDNDHKQKIIDRSTEKFLYMSGNLPKLNPRVTSISLLKAEDPIKSINEGFSTIRQRLFFHDALLTLSALEAVPPTLLERFNSNRSLRDLYDTHLGLNATLYVLANRFPNIFDSIREYYKEVFPFVMQSDVRDLSEISKNVDVAAEIPVFCIREKRSKNWIPLQQISSGMQKVLLILTDTLTLPEGAIYIIDEYENSLGISAIDFLPDLILNLEQGIQFFITSHHPWLINKMPVSNWCMLHRKGIHVSINYGEELESRFSKSRQQAFIQLINDPFYKGGVK